MHSEHIERTVPHAYLVIRHRIGPMPFDDAIEVYGAATAQDAYILAGDFNKSDREIEKIHGRLCLEARVLEISNRAQVLSAADQLAERDALRQWESFVDAAAGLSALPPLPSRTQEPD